MGNSAAKAGKGMEAGRTTNLEVRLHLELLGEGGQEGRTDVEMERSKPVHLGQICVPLQRGARCVSGNDLARKAVAAGRNGWGGKGLYQPDSAT